MNPIFSEEPRREQGRNPAGESIRNRKQTDDRDEPFRSTFTATVGVLVALCVLFFVLGYFQPPQITDASINLDRATTEPGQQLRIFLNGPIEEVDASSVTVLPPTPVTVSTTGEVIALQFDVPVKFNTEYVIDIADVRSSDRAIAGSVRYRFSTGSTDLIYLDRGSSPGEVDTIISTPLTGVGSDVLYSNEGISDFAILENSVVVSRVVAGAADETLATAPTSSLELASLVETASESILLPSEGIVHDLRAARGTSRVAFTLTSLGAEQEREFDSALMTVDFDSGSSVVPVLGLTGEPVSVLSWAFVPGSSLLLVQLRDQSVFLLDPSNSISPVAVGRLAPLGRLSMDGKTVVTQDPFGSALVSLVDGNESRLVPSLVNGEVPFVGDVQPLVDGSQIQRVAILDPVSGRFASMLVLDDGTQSRVLFETVDSAGSISDFALSPNEQFVAIEVVPVVEGSVSDGRIVEPRATSITTVIVDIAAGEIVKTFEGFALKW